MKLTLFYVSANEIQECFPEIETLTSSVSKLISRDSRDPLRDFSLPLAGLRRSALPSAKMLATLACFTMSNACWGEDTLMEMPSL